MPTNAELQAQIDDLQRQLDATRTAAAMRAVRADGTIGKTFRFYIDKKIVRDSKGVETGGDLSRVVDVEADSLDEAREQVKLAKDETENQVVAVTFDVQAT